MNIQERIRELTRQALEENPNPRNFPDLIGKGRDEYRYGGVRYETVCPREKGPIYAVSKLGKPYMRRRPKCYKRRYPDEEAGMGYMGVPFGRGYQAMPYGRGYSAVPFGRGGRRRRGEYPQKGEYARFVRDWRERNAPDMPMQEAMRVASQFYEGRSRGRYRR